MKILRCGKEISVENAVLDAATPDAYSYGGQLEKLASENEKLRGIVARFIECTYGESAIRLTPDKRLDYILGYGFEVEL